STLVGSLAAFTYWTSASLLFTCKATAICNAVEPGSMPIGVAFANRLPNPRVAVAAQPCTGEGTWAREGIGAATTEKRIRDARRNTLFSSQYYWTLANDIGISLAFRAPYAIGHRPIPTCHFVSFSKQFSPVQ